MKVLSICIGMCGNGQVVWGIVMYRRHNPCGHQGGDGSSQGENEPIMNNTVCIVRGGSSRTCRQWGMLYDLSEQFRNISQPVYSSVYNSSEWTTRNHSPRENRECPVQ